MLQACKNIIFVTSGLTSPEDFENDAIAMENIDLCLSIILEQHVSSRIEGAILPPKIAWNDIEGFKSIIDKKEKTDNDYALIFYSCKNLIPKLKGKLEAYIAA